MLNDFLELKKPLNYIYNNTFNKEFKAVSYYY